MKQDGTFLCFMRPLVGEELVEPVYGGGGEEKQLMEVVDLQAAGGTAAGAAAATGPGAAAGTGPEGEGKVFRGGVVGEFADGTLVIRGGTFGGV